MSLKPLMVICVYMPCKGSKTSDNDFCDVLEQLRAIMEKYSYAYRFLLCGDWNCDISENCNNKSGNRQKVFKIFIEETKLLRSQTDTTFIHPNGKEVSTIDYILRSNDLDPDSFLQSVLICYQQILQIIIHSKPCCFVNSNQKHKTEKILRIIQK